MWDLFFKTVAALLGIGGFYINLRQYISKGKKVPETVATDPSAAKDVGHVHLVNSDGEFVGRADAIAQVRIELVRSGKVAVAAIEGMGGIGKTALAEEVANRMINDGEVRRVIPIDLRGFDKTSSPIIAEEALRLLLRAGDNDIFQTSLSMDINELRTRWLDLITGKPWLILIDNARGVDVVESILPKKSPPYLIVTSRNALNFPTVILGVLDHEAASRLAYQIANRRRENTLSELDAGKLAQFCGDHPLVIKSIAGSISLRNIKFNELANIEAFFAGDRDQNKKVLGRLEVSIDALSLDDQRIFSVLSLFTGKFTHELASKVCGTKDVTAALRRLAGSHTIEELGPDSYRLHDLYRVIADYRLKRRGKGRTNSLERYSSLFSTLLREVNQRYRRGGQEVATALLDLDRIMSDVRAAQSWSMNNWTRSKFAAVCASVIPNQPVIGLRVEYSERIMWLEVACIASKRAASIDLEAESLSNLGDFLERAGRAQDAFQPLNAALLLNSRPEKQDWLSRNLGCLGSAFRATGDFVQSELMIRKAIEIQERLQLVDFLSNQYGNLALTRQAVGDNVGALKLLNKAVVLAVKSSHVLFEADHRLNRSNLLSWQGESIETAIEDAKRAGELYRRLGKMNDASKADNLATKLQHISTAT